MLTTVGDGHNIRDWFNFATDRVDSTSEWVNSTTDRINFTTDRINSTTDWFNSTTDSGEFHYWQQWIKLLTAVNSTTDYVYSTTDRVNSTTDWVNSTTDCDHYVHCIQSIRHDNNITGHQPRHICTRTVCSNYVMWIMAIYSIVNIFIGILTTV